MYINSINPYDTGIPQGGHCTSSQLKTNKVRVSVAQSCLTLCDPMDWSPPGSSVHGILQARILEWAAIPFSRGSSQPRDLPNPGIKPSSPAWQQVLSSLSHQGSSKTRKLRLKEGMRFAKGHRTKKRWSWNSNPSTFCSFLFLFIFFHNQQE